MKTANLGLEKELQPIGRFIRFFLCDADLRDKICLGTRTTCRSIIGSNGGRRTQELLSKDF